jgi:2-oxoglutarate ferredoxin oxidoreductase subunit alpha
VGKENYRTLVVGWGSTYHVIKEALDLLGRDDVGFLHFKQVYPLPLGVAEYFTKAKEIIVVENNATSQFGKLLRLHLGVEARKQVLKYDGLPFAVEDVLAYFENNLV